MRSRYKTFIEDYVQTRPILTKMSRHGVLVDRTYQDSWREQLEERLHEAEAELQSAVPNEVRFIRVYKTKPNEVKPFLYSSPKQVKSYLRHMNYPIPRNTKTDKETTDKHTIESLSKKHPKDRVLHGITECRELSKATSFIYDPDDDGRVHSNFGFHPSTGRLSSRDPNVFNILRRGSFAKDCRRQFVAGPDRLLVEMDYRAIEAIIAGWLAGDEAYVRAAKLGIHAILASYVLKDPIDLNLSDDVIKRRVKKIKIEHEDLYLRCKGVTFLSNYRGTPFRIKAENQELFSTIGEARELQELYFNTLGTKIRDWQKRTLWTASRVPHYLETPFGYRHSFWDVFTWKDGVEIEGTDAKRCLAFGPQSIAASRLKRSLRKLAPKFLPYMRWPIYDSVLFEWPKSELGAVEEAKAIMEEPTPELDGISFEVETKVGENWAEMSEM